MGLVMVRCEFGGWSGKGLRAYAPEVEQEVKGGSNGFASKSPLLIV